MSVSMQLLTRSYCCLTPTKYVYNARDEFLTYLLLVKKMMYILATLRLLGLLLRVSSGASLMLWMTSVASAAQCQVIKTGCSCQFDNGTIVDLTSAGNTDGTAK